jgi:ABC-type glycerol-3-phosphate transport system substrate-binding protein
MNVLRVLRPARKILTASAVAAVAAACLGSATTTPSAAVDHRSDSVQATKEWKTSSRHDVVLATKEWKSATATSRSTKEW